MCATSPTRRQGSSPLTRGKLDVVDVLVLAVGLIPAHAGKTLRAYLVVGGRAAHPRSRGENVCPWLEKPATWGSSPLTRGKLRLATSSAVWNGSSPLTRGKPRRGRRHREADGAHPRSRGENSPVDPVNVSIAGSSPLKRGKRLGERLGKERARLIPAHAGKTQRRAYPPPEPGAHPRSRGENAYFDWVATIDEGSSPLTRGKHMCRERLRAGRGLIPAHAGKTSASTPVGSASRAHPRSRGENGRRGGPAGPR